jgi:hypothetical protein
MFPRCPHKVQGCPRRIPKGFQKDSKRIPKGFQKVSKRIPKGFQKVSKRILRGSTDARRHRWMPDRIQLAQSIPSQYIYGMFVGPFDTMDRCWKSGARNNRRMHRTCPQTFENFLIKKLRTYPGLAPDLPRTCPGLAPDLPRMGTHGWMSGGCRVDVGWMSGPKLAHGTPKLEQETPKLAHGTLKSAQETPKLAQDMPKSAHGTQKSAHNTPKLAHGTPKLVQETPKLRTKCQS